MKKTNLKNLNLMLYRTALLLLFVWLLICPSLALAGTVGSNIAIASKGYDQQNPHTIYLTDPTNDNRGRWFVVWEKWRNSSTTGADIYGQFIRNDGTLCGSEILIAKAQTTEQINTGSAIPRNYTATLSYRPILKRSVSVLAGNQSCQDNGSGSLYNGCTGTINYSTGIISINLAAVNPVGAPVNVSYTSNTNQTAPRASYRIEDGKIVIVWQDTRANYVYYNTLTNINFASCANPMASVGTETSIGYNNLAEYDYSTLNPVDVNNEVFDTADGIANSFSNFLGHRPQPIEPGSVSVTDGTQILADDGFGKFTGSGTGTIDYNSGFVSVMFNNSPGAPHSNTETIGFGDGNPVSQTLSGTLANTPIQTSSVTITAGSQVCSDNGTGGFTGDCSGTITYATGAYSVTFAPAPGLGIPVRCTYNYLTIVNITVDYTYFSSFPPGKVDVLDRLVIRQMPKIAYDPIGDQFWIVWKETRNVLHRLSELCFPTTVGYIAEWQFDDTDFIGYVRLQGDNLNENNSLISVTGADILRNANTSTVRLLTTSIAPLLEIREYESFSSTNNPDVSCDNVSMQCVIVFEGVRKKQTLQCACIDKNSNSTCDLADIVSDTLNSESFDDGKTHIYGIIDHHIPLPVIDSLKLDTSSNNSHYPSVGFDPITQKFLVAWEDLRDGPNQNPNQKIYGQLILSGGGLYNTDFIISFQDTNNDDKQDTNVANSKQSKPFVSYDPVNQRFFVVWQDGRNSTLSLENLDIYGQKVDAEGSLRGNNYALFTLAYNQYNPTIAYNDITSEFLTVWKDARNLRYRSCSVTRGVGTGSLPCGSDVYGQRFELGNPSLTLLKMDNTTLTPPLLSLFENPAGSGGVEVGLAATQSFKIRNTGDETLKVDCINEDLECNCPTPPCDIAPFSFDGIPSQLTTCSDGQTIDLVPAAELTFTVRFTPLIGGSFNRCFIIESDGGSPQVNLSAFSKEADIRVTYPDAQVAPPTPPGPIPLYDFLTVNIGTSKDGTFIVRNAGIATLSILSIDSPTTPFSIQTNNCTSVAPGATCNIVVRFMPIAIGLVSSQFSIHSNDPDTPILTIPIQGTGQGAPHMTVSPPSINFGNVQLTQTSQQVITITSDGTLPLTVNTISSPGGFFSIVADTCSPPVTLPVPPPPGNSCQITVQFAPTAPGGSVSSSITITPALPAAPVTVSLSGTGVTTPQIRVTPGALPFLTTLVGSSSSLSLDVRNVGTANLNITGMVNPVAPFSITGNDCPFTLVPITSDPTAFCTVTLTFAPTSGGYQSSSFTINSNDPVNPSLPVNLSGTGSVVPNILVSPSPLDFGGKLVGTTTDLNITVSNNGTANLSITSVSPPADGHFTITANPCTGASLNPAASCQITIRFIPTAVSPYSSSITINSNDPDTPAQTVTINGSGLQTPDINVTVSPPGSNNFGSIAVGSTSAPSTITVSNPGTGPLNITGIVNPTGDFHVTGTTCGGPIAVAGTCTITVVFTPTATGFAQSTLVINSNDPDTPAYTVYLSGTGTLSPDIDVSPITVGFGTVTVMASAESTITVMNVGTGSLTIASVSVPAVPQFSISSNTCTGTSLGPSASCQVKVKFTPTDAIAYSSSIVITSNDADETTVTVNLSGTGAAGPNIQVSPLEVPFYPPSIKVGTISAPQTLTVTNTGGTNLVLTSIVYPRVPYRVTADTCTGMTLGASASCTLTIVFNPTSTGYFYPYYMYINSNDPDTPKVTITLRGVGIR